MFEANCGEFHEELVKILGRLRYRTSYGQNVLKHTLEVVHLAGIMAASSGQRKDREASSAAPRPRQGADPRGRGLARLDLGADTPERYGESAGVVHAIEAHHYEVQPQTVEAVLVIAADAVSASRPGARGESLESVHQAARGARGARGAADRGRARVRASGWPGDSCDRQAGRRSATTQAVLLSHEIAREIEEQLEYPGQIKVTVIRESRAVEFAEVSAGPPACLHPISAY